MTSRRGMILLLGASLLGGCGWSLRGTRKNVLGPVKRVHVTMPSRGPLYAYLINELSYVNVYVVGDPGEADVRITLSGESYDRRVLSVDPDTGKVREVELTLTMQLDVRAADGSLISAPEVFRWTEDFVFDEVSLLGTNETEAVLRQEMAKAAARALVLKLETIDFSKAVRGAGRSAGQP